MNIGPSITDKQLEKIDELTNKGNRTAKQQEELDYLIKKSNTIVVPDTTKRELLKVYANEKYGRRKVIRSKYLEKGIGCEEDSLTLLSMFKKKLYKKNDVRLRNDFIQGEPDTFEGIAIDKASKTIDTKTSWDLDTFLWAKFNPLDPEYEFQGHGYMWLTGARSHEVAFCLVNSPAKMITQEKTNLAYNFKNEDYRYDPKYIEMCKQIERNHIFDVEKFVDDNPFFELHTPYSEMDNLRMGIEDRIHIKSFQRNENIIREIESNVIFARDWMNKNPFAS